MVKDIFSEEEKKELIDATDELIEMWVTYVLPIIYLKKKINVVTVPHGCLHFSYPQEQK